MSDNPIIVECRPGQVKWDLIEDIAHAAKQAFEECRPVDVVWITNTRERDESQGETIKGTFRVFYVGK